MIVKSWHCGFNGECHLITHRSWERNIRCNKPLQQTVTKHRKEPLQSIVSCLNDNTNLGNKFLCIACECFPRGHALRPIFNRNTLKLSYSRMPNVKSTTHAHNKCLLKQTNPSESISGTSLCNCHKKEDCPLENQCLTRGIIYQATVTTEQGSECYVGLTDTD